MNYNLPWITEAVILLGLNVKNGRYNPINTRFLLRPNMNCHSCSHVKYIVMQIYIKRFNLRLKLLQKYHMLAWECLILTPAWKNNHIHYKVWDKITCSFPNVTGCIVEVWEWIINFIPHFTGHVITYPCWDKSGTMLIKGYPGNDQIIVTYCINWNSMARKICISYF